MGSTEPAVEGVLPVDKPRGPTSHDVVGAVRRALRTRRVGHTGTLDPFASGLLLVCVGPATRIAEYLTGLDKRYTATVRLGVSTDTDDDTGTVTGTADPSGITQDTVDAVLARMTGDVLQRPPAYSAKKVAGERAYALARSGRDVQLEPVPVRIDELQVTRFAPPVLQLDVACGSGTYIRAIARDLGEALGVGAHLTALRRTAVGPHAVEGALTLEELGNEEQVHAALLPPADGVRHLPHVELDDDQLHHLRHGRTLNVPVDANPGQPIALLHGGVLVGIGEQSGDRVQPRKVFA